MGHRTLKCAYGDPNAVVFSDRLKSAQTQVEITYSETIIDGMRMVDRSGNGGVRHEDEEDEMVTLDYSLE